MPTATLNVFPTDNGHGWIRLIEDGPADTLYELSYGHIRDYRDAQAEVLSWALEHNVRIRLLAA